MAAGHRFDIIVQALSENTLSEVASADYHLENGEPDGYFMKRKNMPAIEWLYTIVEDEGDSAPYERGARGDVIVECGYATNNKGTIVPVLYKNNENQFPGEVDYADVLYYDGSYSLDGKFYDYWRKIDHQLTWDSDHKIYILTNVIVNNNTFLPDAANLPAWELKYCLDNDIGRFLWADVENGKGVIYYMKDEYGNECPYDFKNIMFKRDNVWQTKHENLCDLLGIAGLGIEWFYTFSWIVQDAEVEDLTLRPDIVDDEHYAPGVQDNSVQNRIDGIHRRLNDNVFIVTPYNLNGYFTGVHNNKLIDCYSNTFGNGCHNNTFSESCNKNILAPGCSNNIFGYWCIDNELSES